MGKENEFFNEDCVVETRGDSIRKRAQERVDRIDKKNKNVENAELGLFSEMLANALGQVEVINISPPIAWAEKEEKLETFLSEQSFNKRKFSKKIEQIRKTLKEKGVGIALEEMLSTMREEIEKSL